MGVMGSLLSSPWRGERSVTHVAARRIPSMSVAGCGAGQSRGTRSPMYRPEAGREQEEETLQVEEGPKVLWPLQREALLQRWCLEQGRHS